MAARLWDPVQRVPLQAEAAKVRKAAPIIEPALPQAPPSTAQGVAEALHLAMKFVF